LGAELVETGLQGRKVLVTGGSNGIGRAIAEAFVAERAGVAVTYRDARGAAEAAVEGADPGVTVQMDLEAPETVSAAVEEAVNGLDGLDVLVVNAVRWPTAFADRIEEVAEDEWRTIIRANLEGAFALAAAAAPALRAGEWGRVVFLSSGIAEEGHPTSWPYAAAKAGMHGLARTLAWDMGRDGVLVNVIGTGFTRTDHGVERFGPEIYGRTGQLTPQGRVSDPGDVARLVLFLGSAANTSVTGEVVREGTSAARTSLVAAEF
jgi:NAD(P)-dependent dehydrogenase (short-subunit alcohol dehydrogenase family)